MTMQRDNVKAGLFVLSGIVLTFVVILALTDVEALFERHQTVTVVYQLSDGLQGLKQDADVTLGDVPVGIGREDRRRDRGGHGAGHSQAGDHFPTQPV